ncbi:MAG TPA: AraC family transcriptional regulator [Spirochaetia bacterium]|nr:AraC family transcriptional regulator [Spirochaetia bacterium]
MVPNHFHKRDGFRGEISFVLPQDVVAQSAQHPLTHALYVTDIGFYPAARYHFRERPRGATENILILCTNGRGWVQLHDSRLTVGPHEAVVIPCNIRHAYGAAASDPWTIYWGHFAGEWSRYFVSRLKDRSPALAVSETAEKRALQTFAAVFETLRRGYTVENVISSGLGFGEILGALMFANELFHPSLENDANRRIDLTIQHMLSAIEENLDLPQLSAKACLSVTHYSKLFKMKTGFSPIEYFTRLKVQHACHYLDSTDWKVYAISERLGYADPYYFSRVFHKVMGVSPYQYRTRHLHRGAEAGLSIEGSPE